MALSTTILLLSMMVLIPLSAFVIVMLAMSSAELATLEMGGIQNENDLWN